MLRVVLLSKIICSLLKSEDVGMPQDLTALFLVKILQQSLVKFKLDIASVQSDISYYRVFINILMVKRFLK